MGDFVSYWEKKVDFVEIQHFVNLFIDQSNYHIINQKYNYENNTNINLLISYINLWKIIDCARRHF